MTPKSAAAKARTKRQRALFNLFSGEDAKILKFQKGKCPILGRVSRKYVIDHDHKTGLVRGILDWQINRALAYFKDDPAMLRRAADYLDNPPATLALGEKVYGVVGKVTRKVKNRRYGPDQTKEPMKRTLNTRKKTAA